jgi:hypothetical protein
MLTFTSYDGFRTVQDFWKTPETGQEIKVDRINKKGPSVSPRDTRAFNCFGQNPTVAGQHNVNSGWFNSPNLCCGLIVLDGFSKFEPCLTA